MGRAALTLAAVTEGWTERPRVIRDFHHLVQTILQACRLGSRHPVSGNFALGAAVRKNQAEYSAANRGSALAANVNEASVLLYNIGSDP